MAENTYSIPSLEKEGTRFSQSGEQIDLHTSNLPRHNSELTQEALRLALESEKTRSYENNPHSTEFGRGVTSLAASVEKKEQYSVYDYLLSLGQNIEKVRELAKNDNPSEETAFFQEDDGPGFFDRMEADHEQAA